MDRIFKPAMALMGSVRYPIKFGIIFVVVLIPLVVLSWNQVTTIRAEIALLESERTGLAYVKVIRQPIEHVQQHRGMMAAHLGGASGFRERIMEKRDIVDKKLAELKQIDNKLGAQFETGNSVADLMGQWNRIKASSMEMDMAEAIKLHSSMIANMLALTGHIADTSQITLDPTLDSFYLGDAIVSTLPKLLENMGQARAAGSSVAAAGEFIDPKVRTNLAVLSNNIDLYFSSVSAGLDAAYEENSTVGSDLKAPTDSNNDAVHKMRVLLNDELLDAANITVSSDTVYSAATVAIGGSYALYDALVPELNKLFTERIESGHSTMNLTIAVVAAVLLLVAWMFAGFYFSVSESIALISNAAGKLADGDLTAHLELTTRDEMVQIADSFNSMAGSFSQVISEISGSTQQIGSSSEALSTVTAQSRQSLTEQKMKTEEVATAMNEMSSTVGEVSKSISESAKAAEEANSATDDGQRLVDDAARAVQKLAEKIEGASEVIGKLEVDSENINTVLEVIKGVAEQTNLLALNAAIEAARAGEHGRGFAVVADEVRTLAGRTQESTEEINQVIEKLQSGSRKAVEVMNQSTEEAQDVIERTTKAGDSLNEIAQAVGRINDMSAHIASAAEEQSATTEEINRNIWSISDMADKTSSGAEKTASASEDLAQLGTQLQRLVTQFKT